MLLSLFIFIYLSSIVQSKFNYPSPYIQFISKFQTSTRPLAEYARLAIYIFKNMFYLFLFLNIFILFFHFSLFCPHFKTYYTLFLLKTVKMIYNSYLFVGTTFLTYYSDRGTTNCKLYWYPKFYNQVYYSMTKKH